jgi:hypothetical protein
MVSGQSAKRRIDFIDIRERVGCDPCPTQQPSAIEPLVFCAELLAGERAGHGMWKGLETHRTQRRGSSIEKPIMRPKQSKEFGSVDHPSVKGMNSSDRHTWCRE